MTQPKDPPLFNFTNFTLDEVNNILAALQEIPAKICNPLSEKIRNQAQAQIPVQESVPAQE